MGDRGQVFFKETGVYLYTHNGASCLIEDVYKALNKRLRWNDVEYLTRIVFDVMKGEEAEEEFGFGIGNTLHTDIWRLIEIDNTTITIKKIELTIQHTYNHITEFSNSFEKFIEEYENGRFSD